MPSFTVLKTQICVTRPQCVKFFSGLVWLLCNSIPSEASEGIITQSQVWALRWPVRWSGQHWRSISGNFTHVFSNSKCVICRCFVQLNEALASIQRISSCHETVLRHVQARVLINRTITETRSFYYASHPVS